MVSEEVDRMSRKNLKTKLITLLACTALLFAALGCESVTGPSSPDSSLPTSDGANFHTTDGVSG
jgi:hypothetical protein